MISPPVFYLRERSYTVARAVTPSDTVDFLDGPCDALWSGTTGTIAIVGHDGSVGSFAAINDSGVIAVKAKRINTTGTTATGIVALYY